MGRSIYDILCLAGALGIGVLWLASCGSSASDQGAGAGKATATFFVKDMGKNLKLL